MACNGQFNPKTLENQSPELAATLDSSSQIGEYVVEIYEDSKGHLWFGTMSEGAARYDGNALTYFTTNDGLPGNTVATFAEDQQGNLWIGTHSGLSRFDGSTFTNFTEKDGLCNERVSNLLVDKTGTLWIGTWNGVCRLDLLAGQAGISAFTPFPLPVPEVVLPDYVATRHWVSDILEDRQGNLWFSRSGYGACRYDGKNFTQFSKKDGLASDCVQTMTEDRQGNIWFGSRVPEKDHPDPAARTGNGGLTRYDGKSFVQFPDLEGLSKNDVYTIYKDKTGGIWIGATGYGVYRYDGKNFEAIRTTDRMDLTGGFGLQAALEDRNGTLFFGFSGGLFRLQAGRIVNVTQEGPWR